jgi:hypothetical protein
MSDPKKTPQPPKQQPPRPIPSKPETLREKRGLPPVDQTPAMPPVKPPKKEQ